MNTIIQINSYFDILIYAQRSLYVKCYSSCIHNFRTTYYFIFRHFMTRRLFDIFLHNTTPFVSTRFLTYFDIMSIFVEYVFRGTWSSNIHVSTLFDIIWHHLTQFDKLFCLFLLVFVECFWYRTGEGRMSNDVAICRKVGVGFIFRLNSTKFAGATTLKNLWGKNYKSRQLPLQFPFEVGVSPQK